MPLGTIRKLIHLCNGVDFASTHLVSSHNGVGYGYIQGLDGDVFFDNAGLKNLRFDQLQEKMNVEYVLEDTLHLRAMSVTALSNRLRTAPEEAKCLPSCAYAEPRDSQGNYLDEPMDAVDRSSIESFPASDSPAHCISNAPKGSRFAITPPVLS